MANGIIGVVYEKGDTQRAAVSVRSLPTGEKLEKQLKTEKKNLELCVVRAFEIECNTEIKNIETELRELLTKTIGPYTREDEWEFYNISADDLALAIEALSCICSSVISISQESEL